MLVHKGGKIKNWGGECRDVTPTKLQSQNIFKVVWGWGWGGVRVDVNAMVGGDVGYWGGVGFGEVRVDVGYGGGVGLVGGGGQGGCECNVGGRG